MATSSLSIRINRYKRFLHSLELDPKRVIVELNKELIKQDKYEEYTVREDDRLELLEIVGGG